MITEAILIGSAIVLHGIILSVAGMIALERLGGIAWALNSIARDVSLIGIRRWEREERAGRASNSTPEPETSASFGSTAARYTRQSSEIEPANGPAGSEAPSVMPEVR